MARVINTITCYSKMTYLLFIISHEITKFLFGFLGDLLSIIPTWKTSEYQLLQLFQNWEIQLSTPVNQTIQAKRVGSTTTCYKSKWLGFQHWFKESNLDALVCAVRSVLSSPQCVLDRGLPLLKSVLWPFLPALMGLVMELSLAGGVPMLCWWAKDKDCSILFKPPPSEALLSLG